MNSDSSLLEGRVEQTATETPLDIKLMSLCWTHQSQYATDIFTTKCTTEIQLAWEEVQR